MVSHGKLQGKCVVQAFEGAGKDRYIALLGNSKAIAGRRNEEASARIYELKLGLDPR